MSLKFTFKKHQQSRKLECQTAELSAKCSISETSCQQTGFSAKRPSCLGDTALIASGESAESTPPIEWFEVHHNGKYLVNEISLDAFLMHTKVVKLASRKLQESNVKRQVSSLDCSLNIWGR